MPITMIASRRKKCVAFILCLMIKCSLNKTIWNVELHSNTQHTTHSTQYAQQNAQQAHHYSFIFQNIVLNTHRPVVYWDYSYRYRQCASWRSTWLTKSSPSICPCPFIVWQPSAWDLRVWDAGVHVVYMATVVVVVVVFCGVLVLLAYCYAYYRS